MAHRHHRLSTVGVSTLNTDTYELKFLRVDFFDAASSGTMELEFIAFFDSEDAAYQYMHTYKTYTATFMANGKVVDRVVFEAGTTSIKEPAVPEKRPPALPASGRLIRCRQEHHHHGRVHHDCTAYHRACDHGRRAD